MLMKFIRNSFLVLCVFLCVMLGTEAVAQDLDRLLPKSVEMSDRVPTSPAQISPVDTTTDSDQVLLNKLTGLVFVNSPDKIVPEGSEFTGVQVDVSLPDSFFEETEAYIGQPLTLGGLNNLLKQVVVYFRSQSTPVVDVYVPEQDITNGTVQIVVLEGRIGQVRAEGNIWFSDEILTQQISLLPGDIVRGDALAKDIAWLNRNPFRQVDLILARGDERGQTDIVLRTEDRIPLRVFVGAENSGTNVTGRNRYLTGINWGNAFGLDHRMDYQFTSGESLSRMKAHSLRYEIPLSRKHTISFSGAYAKSLPDLGPLELNARSWQLTGNYSFDLAAVGRYKHSVNLGVEYKFSNSNLEFVSIPVFDKKTEIIQGLLGYGGGGPDSFGNTSFNVGLVASPGDLARYNDRDDFAQYGQDLSPEYAYALIDIHRNTTLFRGAYWSSKAHGQFADGRLMGSEQIGLGGESSVRGFDEREINGDSGLLLTNEVRTKSYNLGTLLGQTFNCGTVQFLGFWDYGVANVKNNSQNMILSSVGAGFRYRYGPRVSMRFDYGWQQIGDDFDPRVDSRGHFGVVVGF